MELGISESVLGGIVLVAICIGGLRSCDHDHAERMKKIEMGCLELAPTKKAEEKK